MSIRSEDNLIPGSNGCSAILENVGKIINTLNHGLIAIVTFYTCWLAFSVEKIDLFELHIALNTLGYQFLMAETVMSLAGENSWTSSFNRQTRKKIHLVMAIMGCGLSIAGTSVMIYAKQGSQHFTSNHGILGLVAMILLVPTISNGPLAYFSMRLNCRINPTFLKIYHVITSLGAFILGITCLCLGFEKSWFLNKTSPEFVKCFIAFSSISAIITVKTPLLNIYKSIRGMFVEY